MSQSRRELAYHSRIDRLTVFTPAVRMVVLDPWGDGDEFGCNVYPVIGVECALRTTYVAFKQGDKDPRVPNLCRELDESGWHRQIGNDEVDYRAIIVDNDYGICTLEGIGESSSTKVVACNWPESEDAERLEPIRKECMAHLKQMRIMAAIRDADARAARSSAKGDADARPAPTAGTS